MTKKQRESACRSLLRARGWASCWMNTIDDRPDDEQAQNCGRFPTLGHMRGICESIDKALDLLGHAGNGSVDAKARK